MSRVRLGVAIVVGGVVGLATASGCPPWVIGPTVSFICDPNGLPSEDRCPERYACCSDDPTTANGDRPSYAKGTRAEGAPPLFAGASNDAGSSGLCVRTQDIPSTAGLRPYNCPLPCNPTWSDADVGDVCGSGYACCQTIELDADDCVRDETTGLWRPADGRDALASLDGGTRWNPTESSTHQDRDFDVCAEHAGSRDGDVFRTCVAQLTTANQRGYCMMLYNEHCPSDPDEGYRSVCDEMND